ncbi:MAG: hypothetical protein K2P51_01015, partial [Rhabdochlamydiaceae bacterium]|nr:hypothetical protein [Rhabdochlamydiaceae bacterium]
MSSTRSVSLRQAPPVFVTIGKTRYQLEVTDGKNRVLNGERDEHVWASIAKKIFKGQKEAPALFATLEGDFSPVSKKGKAEQRDVEIKKIGTADAIDAKKYTDKIKFDPKTKEKIEEKIGTLLGSNAPAKPQKPAKMDMDELEDTSDVEEESEIESMEEEEELTSIKLPKIPEFPEFPDPAESADLREQHHSLPLFLNDHELNDTDPNPYNDLFTQIASQARWMRPSVVIDPRKLREKVAEKLESKKASNEDCKKMHEILVAAKDHDGRVLDRLLTGRKPIFGAAKTLNRNEVTALLGKATPPKSGTKEAELLRQAFANYLRNHTDAASNTDYPPFFYEALDSVIKDEKKIDGIVIVRGTKPNFKLVHAGKRTKTFNPSKTAFLCAHDFSNYKVFERTKLNDITTDPTTLSTTKDPKLATQYKGKHVEIEDNNDCAAEALTDATFQYSKKYYPQHIWNGQVKEKGLEMRRDVMKHLYNYPEEFHEENDFNQVISSFTQLSSNKSAFRTGINDKKTREAIQELISRTTGKYTTEEKNFLIKTYALYGAEPKRALDSLFFLGFAKMTDSNIVLVQTVRKKDQILSIFSKEPVEQIEKENCLFIHFDPPASGGSTGHYTSLNRLHKSFTADKGTPEIDKIIKQYNINTLIPPFHRNALIDALSEDEPDPKAVKDCLDQVKKHDLHGYLALQAHFGKDPLTKGPKALTKLLKGQDLEKIMQSGPHLESRGKFYTTLKEYKVGDAEFVKSRVKELKKCDPIGYLMLEELLEGEAPEESVSIRAIC